MLSSFYAVWKYRAGGVASIFWAIFVWVQYALAISIDYPNAILMLPVMIYFLASSFQIVTKEREYKVKFKLAILYTFLVFIVISGFHAYHNEHYFGDWKAVSTVFLGIKLFLNKIFSRKKMRKRK